MNRSFKCSVMLLLTGACFISLVDAAPFRPPSISQIPAPGESKAFQSIQPEYTAFKNGIVDGSSAGRAIKLLMPDDQSATRGAKEADVYRKAAPSVVLIFTKEAIGSGSIISSEGLIVTNYHVVAGYSKVGVIFKPAREGTDVSSAPVIVADVVRTDQVADLALLRLEAVPSTIPPAIALGDFGKVNVGDDVNAIGHPTGENWTYTKGYVSQIRRGYQWHAEDGLGHTADVIQTQTPINPGNSGGPLLDTNGAIIGINAFKAEGEGLNFAIGVDEIRKLIARRSDRLAPVAQNSAAPTCTAHVIFEGRSKDNTAFVRQVDTECHGKVDAMLVIPDDTTQPIYMLFDTNETGTPNGMVLSLHRDGKWNISYWDSKGTGKWDTIGYHPDGKLVPSSYGPYIEN